MKWHVIKTDCYPNAWKVVNDGVVPYNGTNEYFPSVELAQAEADKRNENHGVELPFRIETIDLGSLLSLLGAKIGCVNDLNDGIVLVGSPAIEIRPGTR